MKKLWFFLAVVVGLSHQSNFADEEEDCNNEDPDCCCVGGGNPFNLFTGNISRSIPDLSLAVQVGEVPMSFTRNMTSRPEFTERPHYDYPFGQAGNWRHSFLWTVLDDGVTTNGDQKIQIIDPDSKVWYFSQKATNDMFMTYLPRTSAHVLDAGTNYYYFLPDGTRHHITEQTGSVVNAYRMEGFSDPYSNQYQFVYGTNGLLDTVKGPNTNHYFSLQYANVTNSVDPGTIRFTYSNSAATSVSLPGTFNGWNTSNSMSIVSNEWVLDVDLTNGTYAYKFFVIYPGGITNWVTDPDNEIHGGPDDNSVVIVDPFRIITRVDASDGRFVSYDYSWSYNTQTNYDNYALDVLLVAANYGDGTSSEYTYYPATYDQERKTLPKTANDPMLSGIGRAVMYSYRTNTAYSGKVSEEVSLVNTQISFGSLYNDPADPNVHVYTDALGNQERLTFHGYTANLMERSNSVGYVTKSEYFDAYDPPGDNDQQGPLWKVIDSLSRTTVYTRTVHFGAILTVSNGTDSCACGGGELDVANSYTDTNFPFYLSSKTLAGGRTTSYLRDNQHRPVRITNPDGSYVTNAFNAHGQLIAQRKADGTLWTWTYDTRGRKATDTDPSGQSTYFGYDSMDRLSTMSNALGQVTRYYYNWRGMITNTVYADGSQEILRYDTYGALTQRIDRAGGILSRSYDDLGHLSKEINATGATNQYVYDVQGRLKQVASPLGLTVSNTYDAIGRKTRETFSSDNTYNQWFYDPDGVRTQRNRLGFTNTMSQTLDKKIRVQVDALGRTTTNHYDVADRLVLSYNAEGGASTYAYDAMSRVLTQTDCSGALWTNFYDAAGRLVTRTDPNGMITSNTYDPVGRLVSTHLGGQLVASNRYDAIGRLVWQRNAEGLITTNTYDAAGRLVTQHLPDGTYSQNTYSNTYLAQSLDRAGRKTTYTRDVAGRVLTQVDNGTNSVQYAYDISGNLTNLTDQSGNKTTWTYDAEGRQTKKTYNDGKTIQYTYDAGGRLLSKFDASIRLTSFRYDALGNLTNVVYPSDPLVSFRYDVMNRIVQMIDGVGTTAYTYACGKLTDSTDPYGKTVAYGYDAGSRLTNAAYAGYNVGYAFDSLGRMVSVSGPDGTVGYTYAANGRRISEKDYGNGMESTFGYDTLMRLTNITHDTSMANPLATFGYKYNNADLRTSMTVGDATPSSRNIDYNYDPIGQLTDAEGDFPGYRYTYAYDSAGNPLRQNKNGLILSNAFNTLNQNITSRWSGVGTVWGAVNITNGTVTVNGSPATVWPPAFVATNIALVNGSNTLTAILTDPFGRSDTNQVVLDVRNRGFGYDSFGNLTNDGTYTYSWDEADRLKEVLSASGQTLLKNRYDGLSRRLEKVLSGQTNRYLYSSPRMGTGWLVLAVSDGSNTIQEVYTHGLDLSGTIGGAGGIGGILSVLDKRFVSTTNHYCYHYDANGNVVRLTDTNQTIVATYQYNPFGEILVRSGTVNARFQFSSKEYDDTIKLNYYGYRFYSPNLGRWLNRDPIAERGGMNLYAFVQNASVVAVDFWGLEQIKSVPYLFVAYYTTTLPAISLEFGALGDVIGRIGKIIDAALTSADISDAFHGDFIRNDEDQTTVPLCYIVIDHDYRNEWTIDSHSWHLGGSDQYDEYTLLTLTILYHHTIEWLWGPDPNDPCCE